MIQTIQLYYDQCPMQMGYNDINPASPTHPIYVVIRQAQVVGDLSNPEYPQGGWNTVSYRMSNKGNNREKIFIGCRHNIKGKTRSLGNSLALGSLEDIIKEMVDMTGVLTHSQMTEEQLWQPPETENRNNI